LNRPVLKARFPVHATWRVARGVWNLRTRRCFTKLAAAMYASTKLDFRVVHYAVMRDHVHLLVEASDRVALARGMQGLGIRIARRLNHLMQRNGRVLSDRYHAHILRTPTETKHARNYLLTNARRHYKLEGPDPFASHVPLILPDTFFLHQLE
jgi:REP element-mobilizing transposase RayT